MRVLIADDHPILLSGITAALEGSAYTIAGIADNGADVLDLVPKVQPDILVMDVSMPHRSGLEVLRTLRGAGDKRKIILLTGALELGEGSQAVELGVDGILLKENGSADLLKCLDAVAKGERWIDRDLLQELSGQKTNGDGRLKLLTPREESVAALVARGLPNKALATQLGLSEGTVKVHLSRIYDKLGVSSRTELALVIRESSGPIAGTMVGPERRARPQPRR